MCKSSLSWLSVLACLGLAACTNPDIRHREDEGPGMGADGGREDGGVPDPDGGMDELDASPSDAGPDAGPDAGDAGDSGPDVAPEGGPPQDDGGVDGGVPEFEPMPGSPTRLRGYVTLAADYLKSSGAHIQTTLGRMPVGASQASPFPRLFVCAIDRDGERDDDPVFGAGDDDVLGCDTTHDDGLFDFPINAWGTDAGRELYLTTWFCDAADAEIELLGGAALQPSAVACARLNVAGPPGARRKFVRSVEQTLEYGTTNHLNWNLSCPAAPGATDGDQALGCASSEEEPTLTGESNAALPWNKEFVHVYRNLAEARWRFTSLKPHQDGVGRGGCGPDGAEPCSYCQTDACQRELEFVITAARPPATAPLCDPGAAQNEAIGYDTACIVHGAAGERGTLNPFATLHTLGHLFLRRWLQSDADVPDSCQVVTWNAGNDELDATREGYANFIAVATWFSDAANDVEYDGFSLVGPAGAAYAGSCGSGSDCSCAEGELHGAGRVTRFLVDLWDDNGDDSIDMMSSDMLRIWSTFDREGELAECAPDGRNVSDFREHLVQLSAWHSGWPTESALALVAARHCVDRHRSGPRACGVSASCQ
jgi:hypothetical protein